jgi:hypothetical protein
MGLFKKKVETESLQEQYDKLKEAYEKLRDKYESVVKRNLDDRYDHIQVQKTINEQREFILQLQNKIYTLQEELIAKNKIIQGMDNSDQ